jgi:hypothetical protein
MRASMLLPLWCLLALESSREVTFQLGFFFQSALYSSLEVLSAKDCKRIRQEIKVSSLQAKSEGIEVRVD